LAQITDHKSQVTIHKSQEIIFSVGQGENLEEEEEEEEEDAPASLSTAAGEEGGRSRGRWCGLSIDGRKSCAR